MLWILRVRWPGVEQDVACRDHYARSHDADPKARNYAGSAVPGVTRSDVVR